MVQQANLPKNRDILTRIQDQTILLKPCVRTRMARY